VEKSHIVRLCVPGKLKLERDIRHSEFCDRRFTLKNMDPNTKPRSDNQITFCGESWGVAKKKSLLFILARREAARLGIEISANEIRIMSREFEKDFGLDDPDSKRRFLDQMGIDSETYTRVMRDFACVKRLETLFASLIDSYVEDYIRVSSARNRPMQ